MANQGNFGNAPQPAANNMRNQVIRAATKMRDEIHHDYTAAIRNTVLWALLLVIASLLFAALTSRPLMRFTGEFWTAYFIGAFLHAALGLSMHMWKIGTKRQESIYRIFGLFVVLLALAILVVAYFRAQLAIERGQPMLGAYLVSLFMAILEIVVPTLFGTMLATSWLRSDFLAKEYGWARELAARMPNEMNPQEAWRDEVRSIRQEIENVNRRINEWQTEMHEADADRRWDKVRELEEKIRRAKEQIHLQEDRLTRLERWYPGPAADLQ
ncbi:hypothetical protein HRbin15_02507 [bacterium HR15]|nr:hypothetical protein HRbin15_02507 [bacterium HR15]